MPFKIATEDREKIASQLCSEIRESEQEKSRLRNRWVQLRALYDCEENTSQIQLIEGMKPYMVPLLRPKGERIVAAVVDGITGMSPYARLTDPELSIDDIEAIEADLMVLADDAGDQDALRQGSEDAYLFNTGVWRVKPLVKERAYDSSQTDDAGPDVTRIDWESIDPMDVMCYPPYFGTFEAAKTVGHRWSELLYRVQADMRSGMYETYDLKGGDDPDTYHLQRDNLTEYYSAVSKSDEFVELWELITELPYDENGDPTDGDVNAFLCVVALTDEKLLSIQPYPYKSKWYIEVRTERQRKKIFPSTSIAQRLQGLQLAYSDAFTAQVQASYASIGPITFINTGGLMNKVQQAKPFAVIEVPSEVKIQNISANPQVGQLPASMGKIEQVSDSLTGISRTGTAEQMPSSTTATEVDFLQQSQNEAKDQYTQMVAQSVEKVFKLFIEYYQKHYSELREAYRGRLQADPMAVQALNASISVNGRNGAMSNTMTVQKLQLMLNMMQQVPNSGYDPAKIFDAIVQMMDLPVDIGKLKSNGIPAPISQMLDNPMVVQYLAQTGVLQQIQALLHAQQSNTQPSQQPGANGPLPSQPNMAPNPSNVVGPTGGIPAPMLSHGGNGFVPGAG